MDRQPGLDTLRAVAIAWVMLFHSYLVGGLGDGFGQLERSGWMGVDLFFVLSGFLIGRQVLASLQRTASVDFGAFYKRRMIRILPAFFVVLALYAFWPAWRETPGMQPLWQFPTFTFNLLYDNGDNYAFSHVWSLCVEEQFYLVFPLLALLLSRRASVRAFVAVCAFVLIGGIALRAGLWRHYIEPIVLAGGRPGLPYLRYLYYPTWSRCDGLLAGVLIAAITVYRPAVMARVHGHAGKLLLGGLVCLGASVVLFDGARTDFWPCVLGYPLVALSMALFVAAASGPTWFGQLRIPGAGWLARASYSLYLSHKGVFTLVDNAIGESLDDHRFVRFAIFAVATLTGGAVLHYAVERPFLRWRDRRRETIDSIPAVSL